MWEIGFYALNNMSTNMYMMLMMSISYFLVGVVGVGVVLAGSIITIMRIWDGVTDPFVGMLVDHTNLKVLGKNRPFIIVGQVILFGMTFMMFHLIPVIPSAGRFIAFILMYMVYIVGYTFQCVVTKSAQSCLTNDPAQRPIFAMFDSVYLIVVFSLWYPVYLSTSLIPNFTLNMAQHAEKIGAMILQNPNLANMLTEKDGIQILSGFYNPEMWQHMQLVFGAISAVMAVLAIIGLWRKDHTEFYGTGIETKVGFKDYLDVLAHNRGIQMLVVSAATDKLSMNMKGNSTVMVVLFGVLFGSYPLYASNSAIVAIPTLIATLLLMNFIARKMGQTKGRVVGTWGSLFFGAITAVMILVGANKALMMLPTFSLTNLSTFANLVIPSNWSFFGVIWILVAVMLGAFNNMTSNIVIPMTADCADYEVYRSGRYVPGLMGTLFSFVDKMISSLATTFVAVVFAAVGFSTMLPTAESPFSMGLLIAVLICYIGAPVFGWICNLVAMHFYPLDKEKMLEVEEEIARIKSEAQQAKA